MSFFHYLGFLLAQASPAGKKAADAAGDPAASNSSSMLTFFVPIMFAVMIIFMLMGRPRQKADAKLKEKLAALKKNDRVVTAGGIVGTIVNAREDTNTVTLRIDESSNAKMQVLRTSIMRVLEDDSKDADKTAS